MTAAKSEHGYDLIKLNGTRSGHWPCSTHVSSADLRRGASCRRRS